MTREQQRIQTAYTALVRAKVALQAEWKTREIPIPGSYPVLQERKGARLSNEILARLIDSIDKAIREFNIHA